MPRNFSSSVSKKKKEVSGSKLISQIFLTSSSLHCWKKDRYFSGAFWVAISLTVTDNMSVESHSSSSRRRGIISRVCETPLLRPFLTKGILVGIFGMLLIATYMTALVRLLSDHRAKFGNMFGMSPEPGFPITPHGSSGSASQAPQNCYYDVGFVAFENSFLAKIEPETPTLLPFVILIGVLLVLHRNRALIILRIMTVLTVSYAMRFCCLFLTTLPLVESDAFHLKNEAFLGENYFFEGLRVVIGTRKIATDYFFSGHCVLMTCFMLFVLFYLRFDERDAEAQEKIANSSSSLLFSKDEFLRFFCCGPLKEGDGCCLSSVAFFFLLWKITLVSVWFIMVLVINATKFHYGIDCVAGCYVTGINFFFYHHLQKQKFAPIMWLERGVDIFAAVEEETEHLNTDSRENNPSEVCEENTSANEGLSEGVCLEEIV